MIEALILGIVQGLTEFLPVSSTAHLILFPWFFHWGGLLDTLTFDVALHAGTLLALLICFWRDWIDLFTKKQRHLALIVIASIPAGVLGLLFNHIIEDKFRTPYIISTSLVVFGIVMLISERGRKDRDIEKLTLKDAIVIGLAQAVALIPGVSRSGITISAGLFRGLDREASARFSFLLSTPVIAGAVLLHTKKILTSGGIQDMNLFAVGVAASTVTGVVAIKLILGFFKRHPLNVFVYYRVALAAMIIAGIWLKG